MTTYGQSVSGEERHDGARPRARADGLGTIASPRPGHLADLIAAEIRERWHARRVIRRERDRAAELGRRAAEAERDFEDAVLVSEAWLGHVRGWQADLDENDRELRTLLRVLRMARR